MSVLHPSTKFTSTRSRSLINHNNGLRNFTKKFQMKQIFINTEYEDESFVHNKSTRNFETKSRKLSLIINEIKNLKPNFISYKSNFTQKEYSALESLKEN